ncbi:MAG: ABC transporter ATP-binding protein [Planctomycetota bacterium]
MLEVQGLTKRYGDFTAVEDLTFTAEPGEILGLVGPNGAGKTTTLRVLAGILGPSAGTVTIAGYDLARRPLDAKRALAFVPDTPNPFELVTVFEHLRFTALAYRVVDAAPRIEELLAELDLTEKRDALGGTLSRGMRQKLAFACAFLRRPRVLLLDEPLTGLDPKAIRSVRESVRCRARDGATVLVSSHLLDLVGRLSDRILVLARGRTVAHGTLDEIRARTGSAGDRSLEDVFFAITEGEEEPPDDGSAA